MNRDRTIIVVLVVMLATSLFFNVRGCNRAPSTIAASPPTPAATSAPVARKDSPAPKGAAALYEIVPNPEMKGRLGRIVLPFAEGANIDKTRTAFYKAGDSTLLRANYGATAAELPPGKYEIAIFEKVLSDVPVESGKDTRVRSGVLRLHGSDKTRFVVCDVGGKKSIHVAYGNSAFGLPAGEYEIEVSGQREKFTIEPGKITDF